MLAKLRVERTETDFELAKVRDRSAGLAAQIMEHENATFNRRMRAVQKRTGKVRAPGLYVWIASIPPAAGCVYECSVVYTGR